MTSRRSTAPSLGELKARHRADPLYLKCFHHAVCRMASALDPKLLVTISSCLGFLPDDPDDADGCAEQVGGRSRAAHQQSASVAHRAQRNRPQVNLGIGDRPQIGSALDDQMMRH